MKIIMLMEGNGLVPTYSFIFLSDFLPKNTSLLAFDPVVDKGYVKDNDEITSGDVKLTTTPARGGC